MITRFYILLLLLCLLVGKVYAQQIGNRRVKEIAIKSDTTTIDSLSIIPGSLKFLSKIDTSKITVNYPRAILVRKIHSQQIDTLKIEYRVFPMMLERDFKRKDYKRFLSPDSLMNREKPFYRPGAEPQQIFGDNIRTSGSFTRGISFGNNQDVSTTSGMNLKLNGELGSGLMVEGAISDRAIPLQPQGNTRRLEEFDRIYLRVYRDNFSIQAGDIEMSSRDREDLLTFTRNVQGLNYKGIIKSEKHSDTLVVNATASVAKGKFTRNQIQGIEGNQGPYRLYGSSGEPFIIVISGSEKVYIDGVLLSRGEDGHYIIDYNVAEVTFTPRVMINLNSRITVEFEYSERSYARFNTHAGVEHSGKKWRWHISAFSELDAKNQPFDQDLSDNQKILLASIGDNLSEAYIPQVDSIAFNPDIALYQKVDTIVDGTNYNVFHYSTNPLVAHFRVYFTFVGEGKGNYIADFGAANGRIYKWVAPENGKLLGNYEPIRRLVAPAKRQMVTGGVGHIWGSGSGAKIDYALSNTDLNTFSPIDSGDDVGQALKGSFIQRFQKSDESPQWAVGGNFLKTSENFRTIDRFREVEFERNWNINLPLNGGDEQQIGVFTEYTMPKKFSTRVGFETLSIGDIFNGKKGVVNGWHRFSGLNIQYTGFYVSSSDTIAESSFAKGKISLEKSVWKIRIGLATEVEKRVSLSAITDSITANSLQWYSFRTFVATPDSMRQRLDLSYTFRTDYLPNNGKLARASGSHDFMLNTQLDQPKLGTAVISIGYRFLDPTSDFKSIFQEEKTFLGKFEYSKRFWKGGWVLSGGYELGSGQEPTTEFYFVEVPAGQGIYAWNDYNGNGIRELDEFEVARFPDEAKYIRLNFLGTKRIRVRTNSFALRSNINPALAIKGERRIHGFIGRWTNQSSYMIKQKNRFDDFWQSANPFHNSLNDSLITSSSSIIRNSLAFNRSNRKYGAEYIFTNSKTKSMLSSGFEIRDAISHRILTWIGIGKYFTARSEVDFYENSALSQFFQNRNFEVSGMEPTVSLRYTSDKDITIEATYRWFESKNSLQAEKAKGSGLTLQGDLSGVGKYSAMVKVSMVINEFTGQPDSPVAYEMLRGLQPGRNWVWETVARRRLSTNFEIELGYNGRVLSDVKVVHTGSMQARALF